MVHTMSAGLAEGTVFAGRYRIVRRLAAGGMGAVYEAVHIETNRRKALKVMHAHLFQSDEMSERFKREARIAAEVESEHIVDVSDAGVDEATQTPFLVMELLRGEELGERLKRVGRLPPAEVCTYLRQTAMALDKTHAASIVHRDLKPANLFLTQREDGSPRIKILDFGVAKLVADSATGAGATRSMGTPLYMAPEQFHTDTKLTGAADIYAMGMMAYRMLVGQTYWHKETRNSADIIAFALVAVRGPQESAVQRAAAAGVTLPPAFDAWFFRITALEPSARFATASEAVKALEKVFDDAASGDFATTVPLPGPPRAMMPSGVTPSGMTSPGTTPSLMGTPAAGVSTGPQPSAMSTGGDVSPVRSAPSRAPALVVAALVLLGLAGGALWFFVGSAQRTSPNAATEAESAQSRPAAPATDVAPSSKPVEPAIAVEPVSALQAEPPATQAPQQAPSAVSKTTAPRNPGTAKTISKPAATTKTTTTKTSSPFGQD
ncbi:protein kinase [Polyangium sp. 6x1]|uniref:protein kinase domain-containing protein n=1 Tax=Polyangium sp. 6x1 TaxID=3042689 RepID=UPI0024830633|nr:protein kinase [Polyangium sp. 6x1]MDI1452027.1 protein kinase [Polyangium sp. 6x1]